MWKYFALLSAFFAALTAILAKIGLKGVNSNLATAIRTVVIVLLAWGIVAFSGELRGITRGLVMEIADELEIPISEPELTRYDVFTADEVFLTGTAAEVVPVTMCDSRVIGEGVPGPVTLRMMKRFREIGTEWIILTPHFVWGEWMGTGTAKVESDPRPYVAGLHQFVTRHREEKGLALADASRRAVHGRNERARDDPDHANDGCGELVGRADAARAGRVGREDRGCRVGLTRAVEQAEAEEQAAAGRRRDGDEAAARDA